MMGKQDVTGASQATGLAGAEAPEPHAGLGSSSGIPSAAARFVAPWTPSEKMWGGLARSIMMWMSFGPPHTPRTLLRHLECIGAEIPQWLVDEAEMKSLDHSMSKGTRCVIIYRAMIWDGRAEHLTPSGHTPDCSEYVASSLNGITPAGAIDLRVGPRMCVEAMQEAAALLKECVEALEEARVFVSRGPAELYDLDARIVRNPKTTLAKIDATLAAMTKGEE